MKLDRFIDIDIEGSTINYLAYANDVVMLARSTVDMQQLMNDFAKHAQHANLYVNEAKF